MSAICCPSATATRSARGCARAWALTDAELAAPAARAARRRARPDLARRRRLAARRPARHAHADAARDHRQARQDAVLDEPVRVDDRDRSLHPAQRQALAGRRHAQALDRRRHARRRAAVPHGSSATATSPSSSSPSNATPPTRRQHHSHDPPTTSAEVAVTPSEIVQLTRIAVSKFHGDPGQPLARRAGCRSTVVRREVDVRRAGFLKPSAISCSS